MSPPRNDAVATVGVVIANYNYARFVSDAVDSALAQTHPAVEVVVVDDGSTDDSRHVLGDYVGRGVEVVLQENHGQSAAFNAGYLRTSAEIVIFLDADDMLRPTAAAAAAAGVDGEATHVQWRLQEVDTSGTPTGELTPLAELARGDLLPQLLDSGPLQWSWSGLGAAWTQRYLERVMPIPERAFRMAPDAYLAALAPLYGRVRATEQPQTLYRRHGQSNSDRAFDEIRRFDVNVAHGLFAVADQRARAEGLEVSLTRWEERNWTLRLARVLQELDLVVGRETPFVLIDDMELSLEPSSGRRVIPFLECGGEYWGHPDDDAHAIRELERLRRKGARFLVLAWPAFWWGEAYPGFIEHVRGRYDCRLENERLRIFELVG